MYGAIIIMLALMSLKKLGQNIFPESGLDNIKDVRTSMV